MLKFSIIVPVYNVQDYISECIDSIVSQTFPKYEIILIDDGSTDESGQICDKYADIYNNIKVIHKTNGGLSDARNIGIEHAEGEYLIFVDSDDYIESKALKQFYHVLESANNPDILITRIKKVHTGDKVVFMDNNLPIEKLNNKTIKDALKWMFEHSNNLWPAVRYVVKNEFVLKYKLRFRVGFLHEDIDWT